MPATIAILRLAFDRILEISWQASVLTILILLVRRALGSRLTYQWRYVLWGLLLLRLMMPALPASPVGLFRASTPRVSPIDDNQVIVVNIVLPDVPQPHRTEQVKFVPKPVDFVACAWLMGFLVHCIRAWVQNRRLRRRIDLIDSTIDTAQLIRCCDEIGLRTHPRMIETDLVTSPALFGVFRPVVLLPRGLTDRISAVDLRFILLHELVHLKRRDVLMAWIVWMLNALHWFNPILWFAAKQFQTDRELTCDAAVLAMGHESDRIRYGNTILTLVEQSLGMSRLAGTAAMVDGNSSIGARIAAIVRPTRSKVLWSIIAIILIAGIALLTLTRSRNPQPSGLVVRTYDVRNLIVDSLDFSTRNLSAGISDNLTPPYKFKPKRSHEEMVSELIQTIESSVASDSWADSKGGPGKITEDDGQLTISQTQANQDAVGVFLAALGRDRTTQITLECHLLTGDTLESALPASGKWITDGDTRRWSEFLTAAQTDELLKTIQNDQNSTSLTAPRLTVFNHQMAYAVVATETAYVEKVTRVTDAVGNVSFDPTTGIVSSGIKLEFKSTASDDLASAKLDVRAQANSLLSLEAVREPDSEPAAFYQVPHTRTALLEASQDVPSGQTVVLQVTPQLKPAAAGAPAEKPVMFILTPKIIPAATR